MRPSSIFNGRKHSPANLPFTAQLRQVVCSGAKPKLRRLFEVLVCSSDIDRHPSSELIAAAELEERRSEAERRGPLGPSKRIFIGLLDADACPICSRAHAHGVRRTVSCKLEVGRK